ncbi:o-succinylbenzoate synthase [Pseudalkalibacillus decolorationis]|uniref:o-succinylbenzoate synthase n=1 Tax=Pseudalkalibacillus decolorationis TaxID=163879 RepID=UPI0021475C2F|nr:o-succinylbenzoate synthase [Pseudalkalibacillus decolorationis]
MKVKKITIHTVEMKLKSPFVTALGNVEKREFLISEVEFENGIVGWGECSAFSTPWYTEETIESCRYTLSTFLIPTIMKQRIYQHPNDLRSIFNKYRGQHMAKSCMEMAFWDAFAKDQGMPLYKMLGGIKGDIDVGIAIGMQSNEGALLQKVEAAVEQGYKRIKVKIQPGSDIRTVQAIRNRFPYVPLMADANSSYTLNDLDYLKELDQYGLMMIEQPLGHRDFVDHAKLQQHLSTPICLDESISSLDDAKTAINLGSSKVIAIKMSRVGGPSESIRIHNFCMEHGVNVWAGGMLETGIGRAHNIAIATLEGFTIPGDISASANYWSEDIIDPEIIVEQGSIICSKQAGIGYDVSRIQIERYRTDMLTFE